MRRVRRFFRSSRAQNSVSEAEGDEEELSRRDIQDLDDLGNDLINETELDFEPDRNNSELSQVQPLPEASLRSESRQRFEAALQSFQLLESSSAPSSPVVHSRGAFWNITDRDLNSRRVASVESLPLSSVGTLDVFSALPNLKMVNLADDLNTVRPSQSAHKRWITRLLNELEKAKNDGTLTLDELKRTSCQIEDQIQKILAFEGKLNEIYTRHKVAEDDANRAAAEKVIFDFIVAANRSLGNYEADLAPAPLAPAVDLTEPITGQQLLDAMKKMGNNSISEKNDCSNFYGNESDKLAFKTGLVSSKVFSKPKLTGMRNGSLVI